MNISSNYYNYSNSLFSMPGSESQSSSSSLLGDYASIKSGSYKKLLRAYYNKQNQQNTKQTNSLSSKDKATKANAEYASVREDADTLAKAADKLSTKGKNSLLNKVDKTTTNEQGVSTTTKEFDYEKIGTAVKDFVSSYNSMLDSASETDNMYILRKASLMTTATKGNSNMLDKIGISIGKDNKLSFDETKFKDANMNDVKTMFQGTNSYVSKMGDKASDISRKAVLGMTNTKLYNTNGLFQPNLDPTRFNKFI